MTRARRTTRILSAVVLLGAAIFFCRALDTALTDYPIRKDAQENLRAAYNVATWNVFSKQAAVSKRPTPDNYREPLPAFILSFLVRFYKGRDRDLGFDDFLSGGLCRSIKRINLFWSFAVLIGAAWLVLMLTRSTLFAAMTIFLVYMCFLRNPGYIDRLYTEIPAAAVMVWASILLVGCVRSGHFLLFVGAGALLGLLALTKAVFFYLTIPILLIFFLCNLFAPDGKKAAFVIFFVAGIAASVGPWMLRNYIHFGRFEVTLRGGEVLYGRSLRNSMTTDEVVAGLYLWGPEAYRKLTKNTFLELGPEDYEEGGRAVRLMRPDESKDILAYKSGNPDQAVSFHRKSQAERIRLIKIFAEQGHSSPSHAADEYLQKEARRMILKQPLRHIVMTLLFAWRGAWCFFGGGIFTALNALCYGSCAVLFIYGAFNGRRDIIVCMLLPVLMLLFNAFLTHNIVRYSSSAIPHLIISLFVLTHVVLGAYTERKFRHKV